MSVILATKDHYEKEEDEAERLVRPSPKVKPPRSDKKREHIHERDPDIDDDPDLRSKDMSLNYKQVGGSMAERVATRFIVAADDEDKPKSNKWVRVKNKEEGIVTRVRPETLTEEPGKYETIPKNEPHKDHNKPRPARKPQKPYYHKDPIPHQKWLDPRPQPPPLPRKVQPPKVVQPQPVRTYPEPEQQPKIKPPGWVPEHRKSAAEIVANRFIEAREFPSDEALKEYLKEHPDADPKQHWVKKEESGDLGTHGQALHHLVKDNPALAARLKDFARPDSDLAGLAKGNPNIPAAQFFPGVQLPKELKTLGDVVRALQQAKTAPKEPKKKGPKTEEAPKSVEDRITDGIVPKDEEKPKTKEPEPPGSKGESSEKGEVKPSGKGEVKPSGKGEPKKDKAPSGPSPKRRPASAAEVQAMKSDIATSFPLEIATQFLKANLHPDDWKQIKGSAMAASQVPIRSNQLGDRVEAAKAFYTTDPTKVPPPKQVRGPDGKMIPYDSLPPDEKEEAWATYRNEVIGASLGLRAQVRTTYQRAGHPKALAKVLMEAKLGGSPNPEHVWDDVLNSGKRDDLKPAKRMQLLKSLEDPTERALAAKFFQGQDYLDVRHTFLDPSSDMAVNEFSPSRDIVKALQMGSSMLEQRVRGYPKEDQDPTLASKFRDRIMHRLEALAPEKALQVQRIVDHMDADDYDKAVKIHEKAVKSVEQERAQWAKKREKIKEKYESSERKGDTPYRSAPSEKTLEQLYEEAGLSPAEEPKLPKAPQRPARYHLVRKVPSGKGQHAELLAQGEEPEYEVQDEDLEVDESRQRKRKPPPLPKTAGSEHLSLRVAGRFLSFSSCAR